MNRSAQRLTHRLQWALLAFFCLSALFLLVVYVAAPSIYSNMLLLMSSLTGRFPAAATLLQLTGILPALFPLWYSLCRMGTSLIAVGIAVWMIQNYRRHGVWAMDRKAPSGAHSNDEKEEVIKENDESGQSHSGAGRQAVARRNLPYSC